MYIRHDENNQQVSPQPGFTTITQFDGSEGWTTITYEDFNADYIRRDENNDPAGIGTYQRYDENNLPISVETYQRYDENNDPISQ
jgi:hypothetical protein